jgi:hypothetical protein
MRTLKFLAIAARGALGFSLLLALANESFAQQTARAVAAPSAKPAKDGFITASSKKPGAGITVRYRFDGTPAADMPVTVTLQLRDVVSTSGATVMLYTTDGTRIDTPGPIALARGVVRDLRVQVTPPADGTYYLNVQTEQAGRTSVTSVAIQVGSAPHKLAKHGTLQVMPDGERVVSLPAQAQIK